MTAAALARLFCPPVCVACRQPCDAQAPLCRTCVRELNFELPVWGDPPPGALNAVSSFRHEGAARELLQAFKFGRLSGLSSLMAGYMAEHLGELLGEATVIAVPPSQARARLRGFDPAGMLATEVCRLACSMPPETGVIERKGYGRQRGRGRQQRLAAPPMIRPLAPISGPVVLVDDVITTGATIAACSSALKRCGAGEVTALSFTRRV